ncbi:hypothetical protein M2360_000943 [Rhizobium sp. SG_E_25_P2]|uniref:spike base protein, RCAP_Rcc01079 family n=1 Tax=Rhizobium sp. SG_E_25_P2 TaxID=2879942 RepID=UPI0024769C6C|nr:hypothetical protein [Rhizobium sp. SG_E_25_P2]MDH6265553.1 hypothetical protein [Rhizobium sp. SG_E_25_P2]
MPYDRKTAGAGPGTFGLDGAAINLAGGDYTVPDTVKAIAVINAGNVVCRPLNASADITITGAPVGMLLPWHCSAIRQTGTTATLATVLG